MESSEHLSVSPRPPDPGRNPTSQEGKVYPESHTPIPMAPMVSLMSAGKTIALLESIFNTTRIIVDEDDNDGADVQTGYHILTPRIQDLQTLIYREMGRVSLHIVSNFYDLLEHYH